jgi:very-short-patch-repair endonuclease
MARRLLAVGSVGEIISAEVIPPNWQGPEEKYVDMPLPLKKIIIEYDGPSHFDPMAWDRAQSRGKWEADRAFDKAALSNGYKVLRLHCKDADLFHEYIGMAIAQWLDKSALYTPSYIPQVTL